MGHVDARFLLFIVLLAVPRATFAQTSDSRAALAKSTQAALEQALSDIQPSAAEKQLFTVEVLPYPTPFVTNYAQNAQGTQVQVDQDKLSNYLKFSQAQLGDSAPAKLCVTVRVEPGSTAAQALRGPLAKAWIARLEKHGFHPVTGPEAAPDAPLGADEYMMQAVNEQCAGVVYVEIVEEHDADEDHDSSDVKLRSTAYLQIGGDDTARRKIKGKGQAVVQVARDAGEDKEAILRMISSQSADVFASATVMAGHRLVTTDERYLTVQGLTNFLTYLHFKQSVAQAIPDAKLEERFISPGTFGFAVTGEMSLAELTKRLREIPSQKVEVLKTESDEATVAVK